MFVNNLFQFYWYFYEYFPNFNPNSKVLPTLAFRLKYSLCCASWLAILALYFPNINTPLAMYCSISAQFLGNMAKTQIFLLQNPLENDWYVPLIFLAFFLYLSTNCELLLFILFRKINSWGNECVSYLLYFMIFSFLDEPLQNLWYECNWKMWLLDTCRSLSRPHKYIEKDFFTLLFITFTL